MWETVDGIGRTANADMYDHITLYGVVRSEARYYDTRNHRTIPIRHKYRETEEDGSFMENLQDLENIEEENQPAYSKEGYVVRVHFSEDDYSATDALRYYLKQMTELKF